MSSVALFLSLPLFAVIVALAVQFSLLCRQAREEEFRVRMDRAARAKTHGRGGDPRKQ